MAFDLTRIRQELAAAPLASPVPLDLAIAVVSDVFRMAGLAPPALAAWRRLAKAPLAAEQLGMLAHLLASTSLRAASVAALAEVPAFAPEPELERFFAATAPLTAEMIRANPFRQEEYLRRWIECVAGDVAGEGPAQSRARLEQLDYRKTLAEYERAEKERKVAEERRQRELAEAATRESEARGWRE